MTMNNEEYTVIENEGAETEEKVGLEIIEEDAFENKEVNSEELLKFYEENKDTVDLMGGLGIFESVMELSDENLTELEPQMLDFFNDTLNDLTIEETDFYNYALSHEYNSEDVDREIQEALQIIENMDFLTDIKKDFLKKIYLITANKLQEFVKNQNKVIHIPCELEEGVNLPVYAHETDAGLDIYAREEITINPGETIIIPTGIKCAIPEGYAILIQPRSGQSAKTKLRIANSPGLIDSGYRDDIGVIIENIEPPFKDIDYEFDDKGEIHIKSIEHGKAYTITEGQRFAQMRLVEVPKAEFVKVESVGEIGEDRGGGFGSSGI